MIHNLLTRILNKRKVTLEQLDPEERKTFEQWQEVLQKDELNVDDIKNFCKSHIQTIEGKWANYELDGTKKAELIPYHTIWNLLLKAIDGPKSQKRSLEQNLEQLLKN